MADPSWSDKVANGFDKLKKTLIGLAAALAGVIVVVAILREATAGGVAIDPVVVRADDALTAQIAAQQIARHLDSVQRAGVDEWRRVHVDDGTQSVDLQIPGSPLSVGGLAREVVALFGLSPRTLRTAISKSSGGGYTAVLNFVGQHETMATCQEPKDGPESLEKIYECIARKAMAVVDPKVTASYVFQRERKLCQGIDKGAPSSATDLQREEIRIGNRRDNCSFTGTQDLIAQVMGKGRKVDLPWVPHIYGQVHLARAETLTELDIQQRLAEFDQAIARFWDAQRLLPNSPTMLAVLMEAYLAKGIAVHESTGLVAWDDKPDSVMQFRLKIAESTFAEAQDQLRKIPPSRSRAFDALVNRQEALLRYRLWMIKVHKRTHSGEFTVSAGPDETELLSIADARLDSAEDKAPLSSLDYMNWGNILRAMGKYDDAVVKYRLAADLAPSDSGPALNIATTYLDKVERAPSMAPPNDVLVALGALSDYLAWMTGGGPYTQVLPKTRRALAKTGVPDDLDAFNECVDKKFADEPKTDAPVEKWRAAAIYKICVDAAIDRVSARVRTLKKT